MKIRNIADIYVLVWVAYLLTTSVLGNGTFIPNVLLLIIRLWSLAYFFNVIILHKDNPGLIKAFALLVFLFTTYGVLQAFQGKIYFAHNPPIPITGWYYINKIHMSLLPIFVFYEYTRRGFVTERFIRKYIILFLIVITVGAVFNMFLVQAKHLTDEVTNNFGYRYLSFIPILLFLPPRSKKQIFLLSFCLLMILLCMKRGAILISIMVTGIYFLYIFRNASKVAKRRVLLGFVLSVMLGVLAVSKMASNSDYFNERLEKTEEGNSSGRDVYYLFFIDYYINRTTQQEFLIGMGANATLGIWSNYAHNDWLELAINQGLLGILIYLLFWISFYRSCRKKELAPHIRTVMWMLFIIYFMKTLFSMSYREYTLYTNVVLGYCLALYHQIQLNKHQKKGISECIAKRKFNNNMSIDYSKHDN